MDKESAYLRLPNETFLPIPADHRDMCRFSDDRSQKFQAVKDAIVCLARGDERTFMDARPSSGEISLSLYISWSDLSEARYSEVLKTWLDPVPAIYDLNRIKSNRLQRSCEWIQHDSQFWEVVGWR